MNFSGVYQREKRNPHQLFHPMHNSVANYWTEAFHKSEMKHDYSDELFLNNIHLIPDPLKKNLADTLFTNETLKKTEKVYHQDQIMTQKDQKVPLKPQNMSENPPRQVNPGTAFGGIGSFFSGVMNVLTSVMFRSKSPVNYYDCFDVDNHQGSAQNWRRAKTNERDKNGQADDLKSYDGPPNPNVSSDMNFDRRATVTSCESKLNQVLHLLTPKQTSSPVWVRKRPKKVFVEPGSVGESFEDAFSPEDFVNLPNDSYIEYYSPMQYQCEELYETAAPKTKTNIAIQENSNIVKDVTNKSDLEWKKDDFQSEKSDMQSKKDNMHSEQDNMQLEKDNSLHEKDCVQLKKSDLNVEMEQQLENKTTNLEMDKTDTENSTVKNELVSSCEDKLSRLKALLQEKRTKCAKDKRDMSEKSQITPPIVSTEKKCTDKRFKNSNRRCSKRPKSKLKCRIEDDLVFASEINLGTPPSVENSPLQHTSVNFGDYFDEVSGRFTTASMGSDDSFQIVFNDCRSSGRIRTTSDCDSEDSFIVFEESPESCYTSNDVFGDSDDSDSELEMSDSGCGMVTCKLAHTLTRTVSNLADDSLYVESEDEVDFGKIDTISDVVEERKTGLLIDEKKKLKRKCQPAKKVQFSTDPPKVHVLRVWAFAARQARAGHWERYAVDRERFKRRIADVDMALSWVLKPQHRRRVMFQRFMPWWNQLKRKELAEKKEKEAEEKRKEEERKKDEERKIEEDRLEAERSDGIVVDTNTNESRGDLNRIEENNDSSYLIGEVKGEKTNDSQNNAHQNESVHEETRKENDLEDDNKLQFNNNKIFNCKNDDGKITSNDNAEIAKKIQDHNEVSENSNFERIAS